jgi:hypothetical protein
MKKIFLWLSGVFTPCAIVHLARVAAKLRIDLAFPHAAAYRLPLKISLVIGGVSLILAVIFFILSKEKK